MKTVSKLFLTIGVCSLCFASVALAHYPRLERKVEKMQERLNLSEEQTDSVKAVFENAFAKCESEAFPERRECMKSQRETIHQDLEQILTAEQLEELKELREERRSKRSQARFKRGKEGGRFGPPDEQ